MTKSALKRWLLTGVVVLLSVVSLAGVYLKTSNQKTYAATSSTLNFQARLLNSAGAIVPDGYYNVEFKLYSASSGGSALWTDTRYDQNGGTAGLDYRVRVVSGYMSVYLGDTANGGTAFPGTINWDQELWITMNIGGATQTATPTWDGEMNPRLKLTAVPYAFRAGQLATYNSGSGFTSTLSLLQPTVGNQIFQVADQGAGGTYTLCIQNSTACGFAPAATNGYVQLAPNSVQGDSSTNNSIFINKTGASGNILQLQKNGSDVLVVDNAGKAAIGGAVGTGQLQVTGSGTNIGLVVNQTGSGRIFEAQLNGTIKFFVDNTGQFRIGSGATQPAGVLHVDLATAGTPNVGNLGLSVRGASGQTGDLARFQASNGETLSSISANGAISTNGTNNTFGGLATPAFTTSSSGTNFYYVITATNAAGETVASTSLGMANNTSALAWTQVAGATGYKIYRNTTNSFSAGSLLLTTITNGATVGYTDTGSATGAGLPPTAPTGTKLVVQGWGGQTADVLAVNDSTGASNLRANAAGSLSIGTSPGANGARLNVVSSGTSVVGVNIIGASGQTGNLFQLQDNNNLVNAAFNGLGNQLTLGRIASSGTVTQGKLILSDGTTSNFGLTLQAGATLTNNRTITFGDEDGTVCTTAASSACVTAYGGGGGSFVNFAPASVQADATNNNSVFINKTSGTGNILQLQKTASDVFVISNTGNITATGTYNSNTFTGSALTFGTNSASTITSASQATANAAGNALNLIGGAANGSTTGNAGGAVVVTGGAAAGSGDNNGGAITLQGGAATGIGTRGVISMQASGGYVAIGQASANAMLEVAGPAADLQTLILHAPNSVNNEAFTIDQMPLSTNLSNGKAFQVKVSGETFGRFMIYSDGKLGLGGGTLTRDVIISRNAANQLKVSSDGGTGGADLFLTRSLIVDSSSTNTGTLSGAINFNSTSSGQGIGSKKDAGGNQNGLDFYTGSANRMQITNGGNVGIGTSSTPGSLLSVGGTTGNFTVTGAGAVTAVGVNSGTGLLQGTGGLTLTGTASINGTGTANTTIGSTSSGTVTLQGDIAVTNLSGTAGSTLVCRNASNLLATCSATNVGLQAAYNADNTITTTDARNIAFTLANTATDSSFLVNIATGSTGRFAVQNNGTDVLGVTSGAVTISAPLTVATIDTSGALSLGTTNATSVAISRTGVTTAIAGALTVAENATFNGDQLTNNGSTLFGTLAITGLSSNGAVETAANSVDQYTSFTVTTTVGGLTLSLPNPTSATAGRLAYVVNLNGANEFIMHGVTVAAGKAQTFIWSGSAWTATNIDGAGNGVTLVGSIDSQTKSANGAVISGNGIYLQTADATYPGVVSTGAQTFAGNKTFTGSVTAVGVDSGSGLLQGTGGLTLTGTAQINATGAGTTTIGNASAGNISIQSSSTVSVLGTTNINTTGTANTAIGNATGTFQLTSSGLNVSTAGALTGVTGITTSGAYTQSGTSANTFTGVSTFSASGTALSVTNNASVGGNLTVGTLQFNGDNYLATKSWKDTDVHTGIIIPLYYYPSSIYSDAIYNNLIAMKKKYHDVPVTVIINITPPISSTDANYTAAIRRLHGAGITVLGYVDTNYTAVSEATAEGVIDSWQTYYPEIDGIFFDQMTSANSGGNISYYQDLTRYAHGKSLYPVIGNAGTTVDEAYYSTPTVDMVIDYENSSYPAEATLKGDFAGGNADYNYKNRGVLVYNQSFNYTNLKMIRQYAGMVYLTDQSGGNPWATTTTYLETLFKALVTDQDTIIDTLQAQTSVATPLVDTATAGTLSIGTSTATAITIGKAGITTTNAGALTVTQLLTGNAGATISGGAVSINTSGANTTDIGSGTNTGTVTIGNASNANNTVNINAGSTGGINLQANTNVAANQNLNLLSGTGKFNQTYIAAATSSAQSLTLTNNNGGAGTTVSGVTYTPANVTAPSSGTNTVNIVNFAAGTLTGGADYATNGINFASATGYSNFINTPTFVLNSAGAVSGVTGLTMASGNFLQSGTGTFGTGTGVVSLNGHTDVAADKALSTKVGTTYTTAGTAADDLNLGGGSFYILDTAGAAQVFNSFAAGRDGQRLALTNTDATNAVTLNNNGTGTNKIITGTGGNITIPVGGSVELIFDSANARWRVVGTSAVSGGFANQQLSNLGTTSINATLNPNADNTLDLGSSGNSWRTLYADTSVLTPTVDTAAAAALNIGISTQNALTIGRSGASTTINGNTSSSIALGNFTVSAAGAIVGVGVNSGTGLLQGTGGLTLTGTTSINASGANTTSIGTGSNTGTIGIGNASAGAITIQSGGAVNLTANASSTYNAASGTLTLQSGGSNSQIVLTGSSNNIDLQTGGSGTITVGSSNTTTVNVGALTNNARTINVGVGNGGNQTQTVNIGSQGGASVTNINAGTGDLTLTSLDILSLTGVTTNINTTGSGTTTIGSGAAGAISLQSGSTINIGGTATTGVTLGNASSTFQLDSTNFDVSTAGVLSGITGITMASGNFLQSGSGNFTTGSGVVTLSGDTTIASGKNFLTTKGTDYSTTGTANNVALSGALIRLTGASAQTITGISAGTAASDGRHLTLINSAAQAATLSNNSGSSSDGNKIITGTGGDLTLPAGASVELVYDWSGSAATSFWRVVGSSAVTGGFANQQLSNLGTTSINATLNPNADNTLDLGSSGNSWRTLYADTSVLTPTVDTAAAAALNIGISTQNALTIGRSGASTTINGNTSSSIALGNFTVSAAGAIVGVGVNSGTGLLQGTGGATITGTTQINATTTANTTIGNTSNANNTVTIQGGSTGGINIGTAASAVPITIGNSTGGTITLGASSGSDLVLNDAQWSVTGAGVITTTGNINANSGTIATNQTTGVLFNTGATTVNAFGAATTINMGAAAGSTINLGGVAGTSGGTQTIKTINQSAASIHSAGLTITSGDAGGAASNSGNVGIDVGTATGTVGQINLGTTNASSINIGRSSGTVPTVTIQGNTVSVASTNGTNSTTVGFSGSQAAGNITYNFDRTAAAGTYTICTTASVCSGYAPASGSANYIQNQDASVQAARFSIQSGTTATPTALIQAPAGGGGAIGLIVRAGSSNGNYLQQWQDSAGTPLAQVDGSGNILTPNIVATYSISAPVVSSANAASTSSISIKSGDASAGTSGNVIVDVGTATTTAGGIYIGQTNATSILMGNGAGTQSITLNPGTAGVSLGANGIANTLQFGNVTGAVAQTINIGNNATASSTNNINIGSSVAGTTAITGTTTVTGRTSGSATALTVNNSSSTGSILVLQDAGSPVFTVADGGGVTSSVLSTSTGADAQGIVSTVTYSPGSAAGGIVISGIKGVTTSAATGANLGGAVIQGGQFYGMYTGTSTAPTVRGFDAAAWNTSTGTISSAIGGLFGLVNQNASGIITSGTGLLINAPSNSGTITTNYGIRVSNQTGGTITNNYGLAINDQTGGSTSRANLVLGSVPSSGTWNIYGSSTSNNVIAGLLTLGGTSTPTSDLMFAQGANRTIKVEDRSSAGAGYELTVQSGNATSGTGAGGALRLNGGNSSGNVNGGQVILTGGTAGGTANGGQVQIKGGLASATAGSGGGPILLQAADGAAGSGATSGGAAGYITLLGGTGGDGSGSNSAGANGGALTFTAGNGGASTGTAANSNGGSITIAAGNSGTGGSGALGSAGTLTLQGGASGGGNNNGGNVLLAGGAGTGTGAKGLVVIDTPTIQTATTQNCTGTPCAITQANVDSYGAIIITTNATGYTVTLGDPTLGASAKGRLIYVTNADATDDFTLSANGGSEAINLKPNTTATMIWNGSDWTAAGASSSTDLQAAYDNTAAAAGGAELVLSSTGTGGLTVRNDPGTAIIGSLLEVQTAVGSNLLSVNNNATEYANNGGAESSTFTMWTGTPTGGTIARNTTNFATGQASAGVTTTATIGHGVENTLTTTLTNGLKYQASFSIKADAAYSAFSTLDVMYAYDGTTLRHCVAGTPYYNTGTASQSTTTITGTGTTFTSAMVGMTFVFADGRSTVITGYTNPTTLTAATSQTVSSQSFGIYTAGYSVKSSVWSRVTCVFTAPAAGTTITSSNSVMIRQTDGTARVFYIDNLSVTVAADANHAADGSVDSSSGFATNWTAFDGDGGGAGTASAARDTSVIYDSSGSARVDTSNHANMGIRNNMSITPAASTQYLVSFYARSGTGAINDLTIRYSEDGGTGFVSCVDYNTQAISTSTWTKITCLFTADSSVPGSPNPDLVFTQNSAPGGTRSIYIDALSITLNNNNSSNVQIGGANRGGPTTLLTLDRSANAPIAANNDAYLGSMYYDTTTGRIQCYEADGWGACGSAPDNIVNLNPEYAGAVLNGAVNAPNNVGTMTADFCANQTSVLTVNTGLCASGESRNFYKWTSPQASQQTYSIYVTYQLPTTFKGFSDDNTVQLTARRDDSNATVTYEMYKSESGTVTQCGTGETAVTTSDDTWQTVGVNGNEATSCNFSTSSAGAFVIFKINVKAQSNASAYVGTLSFTTTGR